MKRRYHMHRRRPDLLHIMRRADWATVAVAVILNELLTEAVKQRKRRRRKAHSASVSKCGHLIKWKHMVQINSPGRSPNS